VTLRARAVVVGVATCVAALLATLLAPDGPTTTLVVLAGGVALGELLTLRLEDGTGVPLSYAVFLVLAAVFGLSDVAVAIVVAEVVAVAVAGSDLRGASAAALRSTLVAAAAFGAYAAADAAFGAHGEIGRALAGLAIAAAAELVADEVLRVLRARTTGLSDRGRMAWLALASSGMLMAVGFHGVGGSGDLGVWGAALFAIPMLAAWYSFERLDSISRTYRQTIEALSMAPELGGLVREGHASRVAALADSVGRELGFAEPALADLETAALLHHLGQVTLEDPEVLGAPNPPTEVASVTAEMLREIEPLAAAGEIVGGEPLSSREAQRERRVRLSSQVLKVSSAFDDLTCGDDARATAALEALYSGPGYVYDTRVLAALERVLARQGRLALS